MVLKSFTLLNTALLTTNSGLAAEKYMRKKSIQLFCENKLKPKNLTLGISTPEGNGRLGYLGYGEG